MVSVDHAVAAATPAASLEDRLQIVGDPVRMLRGNPARHYPFWYPPEWTTWYEEQTGWRDSAVLYDQSHHMPEVQFSGPDVKRLLSDTGVNSPANLGRNRAKQFVACGHDGRYIGDAVLFGLEDDVFTLVGGTMAANWVEFRATHDSYDVEVSRDAATLFNRTGKRRHWRYQLNGPRTQDIVSKAADGPIEHIKFFRIGEFQIAGTPVRALNHTMSGTPGSDYTGLELWGPAEHAQRVLDVLMRVGAEFGMRRGGALSYQSAGIEGGWIPLPLPAVYNQPEMKSYREYLPSTGLESVLPLEGSFVSDDIGDYYHYPWDLGYGPMIKFDHDFIGRSALEAASSAPRRRKVWLSWNSEDVTRVLGKSLFGDGKVPRIISLPNTAPPTPRYDAVLSGDRVIGTSNRGGYTANIRRVASLAVVDEADAWDGNEVGVVWGEPEDGQNRPFIGPPHVQTTIRATISTHPLI